jgi:signal transduction histidine kinase/CheY-like chemotaxis protein
LTDASTWLCEYRFRRRSGTYATVIDKGYIARDETGRALRMVGSVSDITETRRLELGLREAAKIESLGRLTGGIAHDFNNLLTVILGTSDLILETLDDRPDLQRMVETTINAAERGVELIRHLLAFARQQPLDPRPVDVNAVLGNAMPLFRQAVAAGIELTFKPSEHLHYAMIDPGQLVTAVLNLVINSRDALNDGGWIRIETTDVNAGPEDPAEAGPPDSEVIAGDFVRVSVSDSGHGMTKDVMRQAFEPFFTTKGPSMGSGLGLSMVYGLMKQSKGHARIQSRPAKGTTVQLYIPQTEIAPADSAVVPQGDVALGTGQHILMAEDDPDLSRLVRGELSSLGYRVTAVEDAAKALEVLAQVPDVQLLFSDIIMPGTMNGLSLARESQRTYPKLRVLLTSGYSGESPSAQDRTQPEIRILSKPYRIRDLAEAVHTALSGQSDENI